MIYLLFGENTVKSRKTLSGFVKRFNEIAPHGWCMIDCEEDDVQTIFNTELGSQSLFGSKEYWVIKNASNLAKDWAVNLKERLKKWKKDDSVIVFFERGIPTKNALFTELKKISKSEEFKGNPYPVERQKRHDQDLFVLGDVWGRRNKREVIIRYHCMLKEGFSPDDILRTLLWHVKNLAFVKNGDTKGMKPFVLQKSREQSQHFKEGELQYATEMLVTLEDKRKRDFLDTGLLQFFLTH